MLELNKIYNTDCLEFMRSLPEGCVDLVVTDPPYEINTLGGTFNFRDGEITKFTKADSSLHDLSNGFDIEATLNEIERICKIMHAFIFCSNKQISRLMSWGESKGYSTNLLVWHKYNSAPFANGVWRSDAEFIVHIRGKGATFEGNAKIKSKVERIANVKSRYNHPTQKPLELIKKYILIGSKENDLVFDPFMGSGTTAIAAKELNRNFIGCEIEAKYCEVAEKRLKESIRGLL